MISKRDLINRMKEKEAAEHSSNLSKSTLNYMAENKRLVDAGLLPKYIGGTVETSNPEVEKKAKRMYEFIFGNRKSRNEY